MPQYILANTDFDQTKTDRISYSIQLDFLSFLLPENPGIALLRMPPPRGYLESLTALNLPTQTFCLFEAIPQGSSIDPWKITRGLETWALSQRCQLRYPFHPLHEKLSSKAAAFTLMPPPFEAWRIDSKHEVELLLKTRSGRYVLKTPYEQSGQGHYFIDADCGELKVSKWPLDFHECRLEKWVHRILDFSSQWKLDKTVEFLGLCEISNSEKGVYQGSAYPLNRYPYADLIDQHLEKVLPLVSHFHQEGYRGYLGVDAFIYLEGAKTCLCPLIEINPRKTMGLIACQLSGHLKKKVTLSIDSPKSGTLPLLPHVLEVNGQKRALRKNLLLHLKP